jgi:VWFA-related protein
VQPRLFAPAIIIFCCASLSTAQAPPAADRLQSPQTPLIRTNTREVIVDVVVTDDKGNQVTGLPQADFEILEDKKPQRVDFFEEHAARTLPPGALQPLPRMPPNVFTNVPPAPESDAVNVLLLDTLNTPEQDYAYARNQLIQFLHNVPPGTRMAIVSLSDRLTFVQGFTTDANALLAAVENRKKGANPQTSPALVSSTEEAQINSSIAMRSSSFGPASTAGVEALSGAFASYQTFAQRNRTLMTLEALRDLARYLANVPGRKNLIWFSSSFPVFIFPNLSERAAAEQTVVSLDQVRKTADALTAARVAVYPVHAGGIMNDTAYSADSPGFGNAANVSRGGAGAMGSLMADASARANVMYEMNQLASDTGGKATFNNNDLAAATLHAVNDGSHYYTLTYSPTNKKLDGSYRNLVVKVSGGKYKLSYRRGYNADELGAAKTVDPTDPLQELIRLGMPDSTEILYGIRVLPSSPQPASGAPRAGKNDKLTGPVTRYSVDFMIRWTDVHFSLVENGKQKGKQWGRIQVELLAYDPNGVAVDWIGGTIEMLLDPPTYASIQKTGIPAHLDIDVPQGKDFHLSTGVYDWRTGRAGTLQVPIQPGTAQATASSPAAPVPSNP